jgi:ATP-dependent RNA helicase RhlE
LPDFSDFGLAPSLTDAVAAAGLTVPTPIQTGAIPPAMEGRDVLGLAQTGTGKTLAFGLPLLHRLLEERARPEPRMARALVLAPTRELVTQIADSLRPLATASRLRVATVVGGQSIGRQVATLARGTDILVATPGRLIDLMDRGAVDLSRTRNLVLDEADHMLDMGFIHALRKIAPRLGTPRHTMLFSATMPAAMEEISRAYLDRPERVEVSVPGRAADRIDQSVHFLAKADKPARLREILAQDRQALTLVFARTKHGAERLMKGLVADGFSAASIHGNKSQNQRERALAGFRAGRITVLVATDVAARGIDIPAVAHVVNYDLPEVPDAYVHRIGRTARAGRAGAAIALCTPDEAPLLAQIERLMKSEIPVASGERPRAPAGAGRPAAAAKPRRGAKPGAAATARPRRSRRRRAA